MGWCAVQDYHDLSSARTQVEEKMKTNKCHRFYGLRENLYAISTGIIR